MTRKGAVTVSDFADNDFLEIELKALNSDFSTWESADGVGTRHLWSMLGKVYELGAKVDDNGLARRSLLERVNADPNVRDNHRWDATKKTAHELLLVVLLSIKEETKAKKSQWFSAIRAASKAKTPATKAGFVTFVEDVGGLDKARKSIAKVAEQRPTFDDLLDTIVSGLASGDESQAFRAPEPLRDEAIAAGGVGLVLVKRNEDGNLVVPLATLTNRKVLEVAFLEIMAMWKLAQADQERDLQLDEEKIVKFQRGKLRELYRARLKQPVSKSYPLIFQEFVEERIEEDEDLIEIDKKIHHLADRICKVKF